MPKTKHSQSSGIGPAVFTVKAGCIVAVKPGKNVCKFADDLFILVIWNINGYWQGCSLGLDVSVLRRSRDLFLKCLGLVS